ncbi:C-type lectin domain family 2 member B-like [Emydura macquarii macquarii]|uniref:C-type lectin domain family 2 member B-like n=1 Tax=Emydura macquarii macquarii TaxID=1129001 RepID=UPI00352ACA21
MSGCNSICTSLSDINQNLGRVNDELSVLSSRNTPCGSLLSFSIKVFIIRAALNQATASCPVHWIGSQGRTYPWKCYYFSEVEGDWNSTQSNCSSLAASLATVDTLEEKEFMLRYQRRSETWIGLTKEADKTWKWVNGTLFNNLFQIRGGGECAYLSDRVISSSRCSTPRHWVCSRPG